jgi:predicted ATPase
MAYPHAKIILLDETGLKEISSEETEHIGLCRRF